MYKNIGADTAGVALWEVVDENWPDETGQLSIIRLPSLVTLGTSWCFYLQGNALVIFSGNYYRFRLQTFGCTGPNCSGED